MGIISFIDRAEVIYSRQTQFSSLIEFWRSYTEQTQAQSGSKPEVN